MEVIKQFNVEDEVEVFFVKKGVQMWKEIDVGGCIRASILEVYGSGSESKYEVETRTSLEINRRRMRVPASHIRPPPSPPDQENDRIFEEGEVVDILLYDDWWVPVKVWEVHHFYHHHNGIIAARTNKSIFYSVQFLNDRCLFLEEILGVVCGSKLRGHWRWVGGKWVPPLRPREPLHNNNNNQRGVVINDKSGDSSSTPTRYSPQQQSFKGLGELSHPRLSIGDDVEVSVDSINWQWMPGKIRDIGGDNLIEVTHNIWSWVTNSSEVVTQFYDVSQVRPSPPKDQEEDENITFNLHQDVEVFQEYSPFGKESWLIGEVLEIYVDNYLPNYCILIPEQGIIYVNESNLRLCRQWISGNWIQPQSLSTSYVEQQTNLLEEEKYVLHNEVVGEGNNVLVPTAEDAIMDVDASSAIKHKVAARTKRKDITWQHCTTFEHPRINGKNSFRCNYCNQEYHGGGINRMKQHLGHQEKGDAIACPNVPSDVKVQIQNDLKRVSPEKACTRISAENCSKKVDAIHRGGGDSIHEVKEGNKWTDQTSIVGFSLEGQRKLVGKSTQENTSCNSIIASNHETSHAEDLNNAFKTTPGILYSSTDQVSLAVVKQNIEVQEYKQDQGNELKIAYGDIFRSSFIKTKETQRLFIAQMCKIIQQIQAFNYENISEAMVNEWDVICTEHKMVGIDNDWLMSSIQVLKDCFSEKKEKEKIMKEHIENEVRKIDVDVASNKIDLIYERYGDIFESCIIEWKGTHRHFEDQMCKVVQQIQATTYDNISETKITEWDVICSDHKKVNIDNEWLRNSVKELKNCLEEKRARETNVKEKIENEKRMIELIWRKLANEDGNIMLKECLKEYEAQHTAHNCIMVEPILDVNSQVKAQASGCHEQVEVQQTHLCSSNNEREILIDIGSFHATREELSTLQDRKWIASPVVDVFGQMLIFNQKQLYGCVSHHYFPTYIGEKIFGGTCIEMRIEDLKPYYEFENLGYHLIECDLLFIPMCVDSHWFLYVINLKKRQLHLLDSIQRSETTRGQQITQTITKMCEELLTMLNDGNDLSTKWEVNRPRVPSQQNMDDCGVYMLKFMECWKEGWFEEDYSEEKIREFRKQIKNDLLNSQGNKVKKN